MKTFRHPDIKTVTLPRVLYALSDPIRLEIVLILSRKGEASCGTLLQGRPRSSMSHHFRVLRDAGILHTRHVGTTHINTLRSAELEEHFPGLLDNILRNFAQTSSPEHQP